MQNFTESFFADEIAQGSLTMVEHSVGEPFIDAADIADVAVSALLDPSHIGCVYELTGPSCDVRPGRPRDLDRHRSRRRLPRTSRGRLRGPSWSRRAFLEEDASGLAHLFDEVLDGRNAHVDDGVRSVLGREPRDFGGFLASGLSVAGDARG